MTVSVVSRNERFKRQPIAGLDTLYNTEKDARYDDTFLSQYYAVKDEGDVKEGELRYYPDQPFTAADEAALKAANFLTPVQGIYSCSGLQKLTL